MIVRPTLVLAAILLQPSLRADEPRRDAPAPIATDEWRCLVALQEARSDSELAGASGRCTKSTTRTRVVHAVRAAQLGAPGANEVLIASIPATSGEWSMLEVLLAPLARKDALRSALQAKPDEFLDLTARAIVSEGRGHPKFLNLAAITAELGSELQRPVREMVGLLLVEDSTRSESAMRDARPAVRRALCGDEDLRTCIAELRALE